MRGVVDSSELNATLAEIAAELDITTVRVGQIEQRALAKCRAYLAQRYPDLLLEDVLSLGRCRSLYSTGISQNDPR